MTGAAKAFLALGIGGIVAGGGGSYVFLEQSGFLNGQTESLNTSSLKVPSELGKEYTYKVKINDQQEELTLNCKPRSDKSYVVLSLDTDTNSLSTEEKVFTGLMLSCVEIVPREGQSDYIPNNEDLIEKNEQHNPLKCIFKGSIDQEDSSATKTFKYECNGPREAKLETPTGENREPYISLKKQDR
ncbi:hypothetical protein MHLP_03895 [Candidatus Mycoplasma haematolamae str. Purdue]|uniref:Uncharacterized protein n=1 Tax=Mycoplasma haematolamae (strain Purdue) TaxID=1212765 RepID=I7CKD4_MYCHA|nr:hypothetical protein [Candidatus Mycoplasma haematolamae]AFO52359.1 hypothetical protein MHLP_03895 [Candidatus Mycoplasma haematolamae str. Purdue]